MNGDRILMTSGAILGFLHERGLAISPDTLRRRMKAKGHPFPAFRLSPSATAPLCARVTAVESWLAECEAQGMGAAN